MDRLQISTFFKCLVRIAHFLINESLNDCTYTVTLTLCGFYFVQYLSLTGTVVSITENRTYSPLWLEISKSTNRISMQLLILKVPRYFFLLCIFYIFSKMLDFKTRGKNAANFIFFTTLIQNKCLPYAPTNTLCGLMTIRRHKTMYQSDQLTTMTQKQTDNRKTCKIPLSRIFCTPPPKKKCVQ